MNIAKLSVFRPIAMGMVIIFILIIGTVSLRNMPVDLFPDLTFPVAAVTVTYDGAGPEEVENLLASPLENVMGTLPNVESISSVSRNGGALILVSFEWGTDMDFATLNMREQIDAVRDSLPSEVPIPKVLRFNPSDIPIMQLGVAGSEEDLTEVKKIIEDQIKPSLDSVPGVAAVTIEGQLEKEIRLTADPDKLSQYGVTLTNLQQLIGSENLNIPSGSIETENKNLPLRVTGEFESVEDLKNLSVPTESGTVKLNQLVDINETMKPAIQESYLNGEPAIGFSIQKQSGSNTVKVVKDINEKLEEIQPSLPNDMEIKTVFDQAKFINQSIRAVVWNIIIGSILAAAVLYLFLRNIRSTLIIGLSIPISIVGAFILMYFSGQTINLLTLGGLALGVGMMVDNSIVILENIYRLRQEGKSLKDAAVEGTKEVGSAIIASTLTTVVVFLPIVFVTGLAAQLFKPLALAVTYSLLASLFTALIIVPLLSSLLMNRNESKSIFQVRFDRINNWYRRVLEKSLKHPKKTVGFTVLLLALSAAGTPFIGTEFLPAQDQSFVNISANLPAGSSLDATENVTEEINKILDNVTEVELSYLTAGGTDNFSVGAGSQTNRATYSVLLVPIDEREKSDLEVAEAIRNKVKNIPNADISVSASDSGFSADPIAINIIGPDLDVLKEMSDDVMESISEVKGVREPVSSIESNNPEVQILIDREKASSYGIGSSQISTAISNATRGLVASNLARDGNQLDIRLTVDDKYTDSLDSLENLLVETQTGQKIPLSAVAEIKRGLGPSEITRTDRLRQVEVTASLLNRDLGTVTDEIRAKLVKDVPLPSNAYKITFGGQDEQMNDAFFKLSGALALAIVLVYMVMAGQFESFLYPFIIMFSVPLTAIGIIFGLLISFQPLGVGSLIGMLILTGIVVNNAIVLVDYINKLRETGMDTRSAILEAGPVRLRPILMTALTTILGLVPLSLGFGEGTEIQQPMAIVIVFGLSVATFITLVFIPVVYYLIDLRRQKRQDKKRDIEA
ncbi:efflux RND transporter permease subunit [Pseudalkalibacillus hwajinpoensis]|uniref:Efflux RND transporter permease subunit n=1 Tax=Guptibacillus hwajinpoensis TaxID=208199 RepID=A0A4U1MMF6_9BACL|nr:efflux RND transporter permease subunit [Pseudalkalibacillus hwajinpoensis]TKD71891.1 efflux RND transporter permease subunit [Pseudalkalibacillus hwajinpoensis]